MVNAKVQLGECVHSNSLVLHCTAGTMPPLRFTLLGSCETTSARAADLVLGHTEEVANTVHLPIFMPVGTQVTRSTPLPLPSLPGHRTAGRGPKSERER